VKSVAKKMKIKRGFKRCSTCRIIKPVGLFYKDKSRPDGLLSICKKCKKQANDAYAIKRRENREKFNRWRSRKKLGAKKQLRPVTIRIETAEQRRWWRMCKMYHNGRTEYMPPFPERKPQNVTTDYADFTD